MDVDTDHELVEAMQQGNRAALAVLYDRHAPQMLGVAQRLLQNQRDAEDLLHDVFIEVWQTVGNYRVDRGSVCAWLITRLRSRAIDRLRTLSIARQHLMALSHPSRQCKPIRSVPGDGTDVRQVHQALENLSDIQRTVLNLAYFQGLTYEEIATRCEIPIGTVRSRLSSAITKLRQTFETAGRSL